MIGDVDRFDGLKKVEKSNEGTRKFILNNRKKSKSDCLSKGSRKSESICGFDIVNNRINCRIYQRLNISQLAVF